MIKIRKHVFETNSSSTHSICVCTDNSDIGYQQSLVLKHRYFGWEKRKLSTPKDKAAYIFALSYCFKDYETFLKKITSWGNELGINVTEDNKKWESYDFGVDHASEAKYFYEYITSDKKILFDFIFNNKSFIRTWNDNERWEEDDYMKIDENYPHKEFYKGN